MTTITKLTDHVSVVEGVVETSTRVRHKILDAAVLNDIATEVNTNSVALRGTPSEALVAVQQALNRVRERGTDSARMLLGIRNKLKEAVSDEQ